MQTLRAFEGDSASKTEYKILWKQKEKYRKKNIKFKTTAKQQKNKIKTQDDLLVKARQENEILKRISVNFEGKQITFQELKDWTISIFNEEIQRRANEKFDKQAARTYGLLEFLRGK